MGFILLLGLFVTTLLSLEKLFVINFLFNLINNLFKLSLAAILHGRESDA